MGVWSCPDGVTSCATWERSKTWMARVCAVYAAVQWLSGVKPLCKRLFGVQQRGTPNVRTTRASCGGGGLIWYCADWRQRLILLSLFAMSFVSLLTLKQACWQQRSKRVVRSRRRQMTSTSFCRRVWLSSARKNLIPLRYGRRRVSRRH